MAVWTKVWSPQMMGVPVPRPGILTFHLMFSVADHFSGGLAVGAPPVPRGPRHCPQLSSTAASTLKAESIVQTERNPILVKVIPGERRFLIESGYKPGPNRRSSQRNTGEIPSVGIVPHEPAQKACEKVPRGKMGQQGERSRCVMVGNQVKWS